LSALARQYFRYGYYRAKTARRHPQSLRRTHVLAPGLVVTAVAALVAPRTLRTLARAGMLAYGGVIGAESARIGRADGSRGGDAAALPVVFATMHSAWGAGFLAGSARFGPPIPALVRLVRPS
jgi:hypothetical protein